MTQYERKKSVSRNAYDEEVSKLKKIKIKYKKGGNDMQINSPLCLKSQFRYHSVVTNLFHKRIIGMNLLCNIYICYSN